MNINAFFAAIKKIFSLKKGEVMKSVSALSDSAVSRHINSRPFTDGQDSGREKAEMKRNFQLLRKAKKRKDGSFAKKGDLF
jgi:formate-dependent nitrite reductase cytochrome c552 subunit